MQRAGRRLRDARSCPSSITFTLLLPGLPLRAAPGRHHAATPPRARSWPPSSGSWRRAAFAYYLRNLARYAGLYGDARGRHRAGHLAGALGLHHLVLRGDRGPPHPPQKAAPARPSLIFRLLFAFCLTRGTNKRRSLDPDWRQGPSSLPLGGWNSELASGRRRRARHRRQRLVLRAVWLADVGTVIAALRPPREATAAVEPRNGAKPPDVGMLDCLCGRRPCGAEAQHVTLSR